MSVDELVVLRFKNPELASYLENWKAKYERNFDFSVPAQQADFFEGITEISKHIAHCNKSANLKIVVGTEGVTTIYVNTN